MKVGDLVKYVPTVLEKETGDFGVIVGYECSFYFIVFWLTTGETLSYTSDSLEMMK